MQTLTRAALVAAFFMAGCSAAPEAPGAPPGAASAPAAAEGLTLRCAPREAVLAGLEAHGEDLQDAGITAGGVLAETFADPESGGWTWTLTRPDGTTCLLAWGGSWRALIDFSTGRGEE